MGAKATTPEKESILGSRPGTIEERCQAFVNMQGIVEFLRSNTAGTLVVII
jgi:hypothetical protein